MKIFIDDIRNPKDCTIYLPNIIYLEEWEIVRTYDQFIVLIDHLVLNHIFHEIEVISFDHDLSDFYFIEELLEFTERTWVTCAKHLIEVCIDYNLKLPLYLVHTQNPVGSSNITGLLDNFKNYQNKHN